MKHGIITTLSFIFTISLITPNINSNEQSILSSSDSLIKNISEDKLEGTILEPSVEENLEVAIDSEKIGTREDPNTETDKSELPNSVSINDTPVLLSENSTIELNNLPDISVSLTSQNEEISVSEPNINIPLNITTNVSDSEEKKFDNENVTEVKTEDIPSFSEWAQKKLEEVEKNEQINSSVKGQVPNGKTQNAKLRWKNYASLDCGSKVVAANPEAVSPSAILSPSSDEYKLNPCTARIWFVVELCEAIQAKKIDLANYELFSSSPKEFTVSVSERYPTRDWAQIGKFTANDERDIQSFDLETDLFGKYIKIEIKSHYGSEHYCPISLFRAYGASVFEVLQKEEAANVNRPDDDDDDDDDDEDDQSDGNLGKKNIFSSATDAVMSVVKRAAQILGTKSDEGTKNATNSTGSSLINTCTSPRHVINCGKCSEVLFGQIYELVSCKAELIKRLATIPEILKNLKSSSICQKFGYNFDNSKQNLYNKNIESFFPEKYIGAICNEIAIIEHKVIVNVSQDFTNITKNLSNEKIVNMNVIKVIEPELLITENSTDSIEEIIEIKPTKTLIVNDSLSKTDFPENVTSMEEILDPGTIFGTEESFSEVLDDVVSTTSPQAAKESIFMRLFNRIKSLERNMSISSQYLEELSKRYKKQVEEMREETLKRDEINKQLEERLFKLTLTIENMAAERRTFLTVCYCLIIFSFVCFGFYFFCGSSTDRARNYEKVSKINRRKSLDELDNSKVEKKRRPSDQVLKIVRYSALNEEKKKKKKKKNAHVNANAHAQHHRSISLGSIKLNNRSMIEDVAVVLDDSEENSILDGCKLSKNVEMEENNKSSQDDENEIRVIDNNLKFSNNIINSDPVKKEKKGFKRLLKKVF